MAITASVERMTAFRRDGVIRYAGGVVNNIVARIPGAASTKAVLLACHYDSVVEGPGASDDAHAVGVLLETARALLQAGRLRNDVILLFTDGEEPVMLGAEAFSTQSRWIQDVGLVMNFEARGTEGPSLMFETSSPDGALAREFARAAPYPRAGSFFRDIYERMPVGTDFSLFKLRGVAGLNFAYIGGGRFYHTSEDNPARMDDRSVQHQGSSALALARHFGEMPLPLAPAPNAAYFNVGNVLIHYPLSWAPGIEGAFVALFLMAAWRLRRRGGFRFKYALLGLGFVVAVCVAAWFFAQGYLNCFRMVRPDWSDLSFGQVYGRGWLTAGLVIPMIIAVASLTARLRPRLGRAELAVAVTATGLAVSGMLSWKFPGAGHLGLAFAASGLLLLGLLFWSPSPAAPCSVAALVALAPAVVIWIPLLRYLDAGLGIQAWPAVALLTSLAAVLGCLAVEAVPEIQLPRALAAAGLLLLLIGGIGLRTGRYSNAQPQPGNIFYALDADADAAFWVTRQSRLDPWSASILGPQAKREKFRAISTWLGGEETFWKAPAPRLPLPLPQLELLHAECTNEMRTFDLRVRSLRGAHAMLVQFQSERDTEIVQLEGLAAHVLEQTKPIEKISQYVDLRGLPPEGMALRVRIRGCGKLLVRLVERSTDLASVFPSGIPPLPSSVMTAWEDDYYNRCVMITRRITLE